MESRPAELATSVSVQRILHLLRKRIGPFSFCFTYPCIRGKSSSVSFVCFWFACGVDKERLLKKLT